MRWIVGFIIFNWIYIYPCAFCSFMCPLWRDVQPGCWSWTGWGGLVVVETGVCFFAQSAHLLSDERVANIFPFFRLIFHFLVSGFDMGILTKITLFYIPEFVVLGWSLWYILNYYCNVILLAWMQQVSRTFPLRWILYFNCVRALLFSFLPLPLILPDSCPASRAICMCYLKHPYKT